MNSIKMTSMERVLTTLGHQEPDRVPVFINSTLHGSRELGLSIKNYFSKAGYVIEGQLRMQQKYRGDCLTGFFYGPAEYEAFGGEVIFYDDGPPNSGAPVITTPADIFRLEPPKIDEHPCLIKGLEAIQGLNEAAKGGTPIVGVAISPFSLPVMQMGFENYLDLIHEQPKAFEQLMKINQEFCVSWANAQLGAGATAICFFNPMSSATIIPGDLYKSTGFQVDIQTIARINGPCATHMASGRCLPNLDLIGNTGTAGIGVSVEEDLSEIKQACKGKLSVIGNLNGVEMRNWTIEGTHARVKEAIAKAGAGGGFVLSDNHGEIPFQVPDNIIMAISDAVREWGRYPLTWVEGYE
jgi:uroporphyrinogen decarboxylase